MAEIDFENEINYQITMSIMRHLKNEKMISEDVYNEINKIMLDKHKPIITALLSGNNPCETYREN